MRVHLYLLGTRRPRLHPVRSRSENYMNTHSYERRLMGREWMDETTLLKCLIDENRRAILRALEGGDMPVGEIAKNLGMEQSLCSHHLAKLRNCGLVSAEQQGRSVMYRLAVHDLPSLLSDIKKVSSCIPCEGEECRREDCD